MYVPVVVYQIHEVGLHNTHLINKHDLRTIYSSTTADSDQSSRPAAMSGTQVYTSYASVELYGGGGVMGGPQIPNP